MCRPELPPRRASSYIHIIHIRASIATMEVLKSLDPSIFFVWCSINFSYQETQRSQHFHPKKIIQISFRGSFSARKATTTTTHDRHDTFRTLSVDEVELCTNILREPIRPIRPLSTHPSQKASCKPGTASTARLKTSTLV